jgi:hypothetical protein
MNQFYEQVRSMWINVDEILKLNCFKAKTDIFFKKCFRRPIRAHLYSSCLNLAA